MNEKLEAIAEALREMHVVGDCVVDYPDIITGGHDDVWWVAGFANGGCGVNLYLDPCMIEFTGSAESPFTIDDTKLCAAFILGAYHSHLY